MKVRIFCAGLLSGLFTSTLLAANLELNPNPPEQYTVKPHDTLWDVAGQYLPEPWQWRQLWSNAHQEPPSTLYVGDTLYFSRVNGQPRLRLNSAGATSNDNALGNNAAASASNDLPIKAACVLHESGQKNNVRTEFPIDASGKLIPCIRETDLKQAIKLIPTDKIAPFLSSPRIVGATELADAPYVVELVGEHLIAGIGDKVYVRGLSTAADNRSRQSYTIYRAGSVYTSPTTGEILGYEARYVAETRLVQAGDPATLAIKKSHQEIRMGDRVMPTLEADVTLNYLPHPPSKAIAGNIIGIPEGVSQIGLYDIVVIDKGSQDGIQVGHELTIQHKGRVALDRFTHEKNATLKLPDEHAGVLMVFRPFERVSYALIMKATQAIHVLDNVQTPENH